MKGPKVMMIMQGTDMEKRRWYLDNVPNMTKTRDLPVLRVGDYFRLSATIPDRNTECRKFPTGLHRGVIGQAYE